uniref:Putative secreted protein n=1 Tax=Anopheles darlingi TaxID=43151 RepID=A0A2M4DNT9_ANODA
MSLLVDGLSLVQLWTVASAWHNLSTLTYRVLSLLQGETLQIRRVVDTSETDGPVMKRKIWKLDGTQHSGSSGQI